LLKEVGLRPEAEQEPGYKLALALGAIAAENLDLDRVTRETLKSRPELEKLLNLLWSDVWRTYDKMSEEARGIWRFASVQTYYNASDLPTLAPRYRQTGAEKFAKAVEIELRTRVFEKFKTEIKGNDRLKVTAEQSRKDQRAGPFAEFLVKKGKLTLGQMKALLSEAGRGRDELSRHLGELSLAN
jgi:hypothetical protein